jgi:predicted PurR-regulated permease PerM
MFSSITANAIKLLLMTLSSLLILFCVFQLRELLVNALLAMVLACALFPITGFLSKRGWPKPLAILACYAVLMVGLVGLFYFIVIAIAEQGSALGQALPRYLNTIETWVSAVLPVNIPIDSSAVLSQIQSHTTDITRFFSTTVSRVMTILGNLSNGIIILVLTFFFLSSTQYLYQLLFTVLPKPHHKKLHYVLSTWAKKVGSYARGQLTVMLFVGSLTWVGLSLIGIPYAFLLGIIAFFLDLIPMLGPTLTFIVVAVITLGHNPALFPWAALLFIFIQQVENYILVPKILGNSVQLHPFWIFVSVLIGGTLMGISGVVLAVPSAVLISLLIEHYYLPRLNNQTSLVH